MVPDVPQFDRLSECLAVRVCLSLSNAWTYCIYLTTVFIFYDRRRDGVGLIYMIPPNDNVLVSLSVCLSVCLSACMFLNGVHAATFFLFQDDDAYKHTYIHTYMSINLLKQ